MRLQFLDSAAYEIPNHEEVEPHKQTQDTSAVRHKRALRVSQLFCLCQHIRTVKSDRHYGLIWSRHCDRFISKLKNKSLTTYILS